MGDPKRLFIGGNGSLYRIKSYEGTWENDVQNGKGRLLFTRFNFNFIYYQLNFSTVIFLRGSNKIQWR
jgi:hypothetical protein